MRIQKYIANTGFCSRRKCENLIRDGKVFVNGELASIGQDVCERDIIKVGDIELKNQEKKYYILLNKPVGYVTTCSDEKGRTTVLELIEGEIDARLFPVGRLDINTSGSLILTNDGEFANIVMHPKTEINKTYLVLLSGSLSDGDLRRLERGVKIELSNKGNSYKTAPATVEITRNFKDKTEVKITIHEGKNRQVRKMISAIGHKVIGLKRISIGNIELGNLPEGRWRHLMAHEVKSFF